MKKQTSEQYLNNEFTPTVKELVRIHSELYHQEQLTAKIEELEGLKETASTGEEIEKTLLIGFNSGISVAIKTLKE